MKFFWDLDANRLVSGQRSNIALAQPLEFKRRDGVSIEVVFLRTENGQFGVIQEMPSTLEIRFALKEVGGFAADPVVFSAAFVEGDDFIWRSNPSFNTTELDALFEAETPELASVSLIAELTFREDSGEPWTSTPTITATVYNDVIRGDEGTPTNAADPTDYLTAVQSEARYVRYDAAQSLDSGEKAQARANLGIDNDSVDVQVFTANGTWTKPANAQRVRFLLVGGGGGGGSGRNGSTAFGGGGGGAGGVVSVEVPASALSATEAVVVGAGGAGGAGVGGSTDGNAGSAGGATTFAGWTAMAGTAGSGGTSGAGAGGGQTSSGSIFMGAVATRPGGANGNSSTGVDGNNFAAALPNGGGGGGGTVGTTRSAGGEGGSLGNSSFRLLNGGTAGTAGSAGVAGGAGGAGGTYPTGFGAGGGGGGSGSGTTSSNNGGAGGAGGAYGGGGGGGGAANGSGATSGAGGAGGAGVAIIITFVQA